MNDVITIGDAMITFDPVSTGPLRFVDTFKRKVGGAELNVAIGCARLGLKTGWMSRLGQDEFGRFIFNFARGEGIDVSEVQLMDNYPTSLNFKEIMEDGSGKTFYYRQPSPTLTFTPESLKEAYFENAKLLHITGVFPAIQPQNREVLDRALQLARKYGLKISMDPNIRLKLWSEEEARSTLLQWMPEVDYLLAGMEEAILLFGTKQLSEMIKQCKHYGISYLFLKRGEKGSAVWTNDVYQEMPPENVANVVDTVGAGDGFDAGVLYGLLNQWDPPRILKFANTIGSMVVTVKGDNEGLPYLEEVQRKLTGVNTIER